MPSVPGHLPLHYDGGGDGGGDAGGDGEGADVVAMMRFSVLPARRHGKCASVTGRNRCSAEDFLVLGV
jgi:hypothetical protein